MSFEQLFAPHQEKARPPGVALRSGRGVLLVALGGVGWLVLVPVLWVVRTSSFGGSALGLLIVVPVGVLAALGSTAVVLYACYRRSWGVALVSLVLAVVAVVVATRPGAPGDYVDHQYRVHRVTLAELAQEYRAGRLQGDLTLPPDLKSLCPSGFAYASRTVLFVQMWQNWRAESGTGLAYFPQPPAPGTNVQTASGDQGQPEREVGDGWWWTT